MSDDYDVSKYQQKNLDYNDDQENPLDWETFPEFPVLTNDQGIEQLYAVKTDWMARLRALRLNPEANKPNVDQILRFTKYLISKQRTDTEPTLLNNSWCIPLDTSLESDACIDFAVEPTYIAVAWLSLVFQDYPMIAKELQNLDKALRKGMRFAGYSDLSGHGYDRDRELIEAVFILSLGKVFTLVVKGMEEGIKANRFPQFEHTIHIVEKKLQYEMTNDGWSGVDEVKRLRAMDLLSMQQDSDDELVSRYLGDHEDEELSEELQFFLLSELSSIAALELVYPLKAELKGREDEINDALQAIELETNRNMGEESVFGNEMREVGLDVTLNLNELLIRLVNSIYMHSILESAFAMGVRPKLWSAIYSQQSLIKSLMMDRNGVITMIENQLETIFSYSSMYEDMRFEHIPYIKVVIKGIDDNGIFHLSLRIQQGDA